jgi:hypothetical protein
LKFHNSQVLWTELTETQSEVVNGGATEFNRAFFSEFVDQNNQALIANSGNALGFANRAGVSSTQVNIEE